MQNANRRTALAAALLPLILPVLPAMARDVVEVQIADVVDRDTPIALIKGELQGSEGPVPFDDGSLLFTENRAGRVLHISPDGAVSTWMEQTHGANALALAPNGDIVAAFTQAPGIGILKPGEAPRVLVSDYQGKPFNRPNDLIVSKSGIIYFTDPAPRGAPGTAPTGTSAVYMYTPAGELVQIDAEIETPNGIALSPDERRLYVANTTSDRVIAFSLNKEGKVTAKNVFTRLRMPTNPASAAQGSGADGLAVDDRGRLYVATTVGIQVFTPRGEPLGEIVTPVAPQNLAFGGTRKNIMYVTGRGNVYAINVNSRGPRRTGK